jgi:hypothetical protein
MYIDLSVRSVALFLLMSMAWAIGGVELYEAVTNLNDQWYWLVLSTAYGIILAELFCHLSVSHQMVNIDTRSWFYKLLVYLYTISAPLGGLRRMCLNHAVHHIHSDVKYLDPLDSRRMMHLTCSLSPLMYICHVRLDPIPDRDKYIERQQKKFKDIINDKWTNFCDEYTVLLIIISWVLFYMVLPVIFFKILMLGRLTVSIAHTMATLGHFKLLFGYRHVNSNDKSHNHLLFHYALGCLCPSVLQHNHHNMDIQKMQTHKHKWYEFDIGSNVIRYVFTPLMSKKK